MKIILSRKGFDSSNGGYPSPILPNGKMVSLPIPQEDSLSYSDLEVDDGLTYYELMEQLGPYKKLKNSQHEKLRVDTRCHLDPDLCRNTIARKSDWRPCFGQMGSAQGHLEKEKVGIGDLFLFFGWFRKARIQNSKYEFDRSERDIHVIFGYLQIGEIERVDANFDVPEWMSYHPHTDSRSKEEHLNTIYIARPNLSWDSHLPGAGRFEFNESLILTKKGLSRSKWCLPSFFKEAKISFHNKAWREKDEYFQSVGRGQEFVVGDNEKVEEWAKGLIGKSQINY